jgi:hypothetical protein
MFFTRWAGEQEGEQHQFFEREFEFYIKVITSSAGILQLPVSGSRESEFVS